MLQTDMNYLVDNYIIKSGKLKADVVILKGFIDEISAIEVWHEIDGRLNIKSKRPIIIDVNEVVSLTEDGIVELGLLKIIREKITKGISSSIVCNRIDDVYKRLKGLEERKIVPVYKTVRQALEYLRTENNSMKKVKSKTEIDLLIEKIETEEILRLLRLMSNFLSSFELVFEYDWNWTRGALLQLATNSIIFSDKPDKTFLRLPDGFEIHNWGARETLIQNYLEVKKEIEKRGLLKKQDYIG